MTAILSLPPGDIYNLSVTACTERGSNTSMLRLVKLGRKGALLRGGDAVLGVQHCGSGVEMLCWGSSIVGQGWRRCVGGEYL